MSKLKARAALLSDAEAIAKLGGHVFADSFGHSVTPEDLQNFLTESYTPPAISAELSHQDKTTLVAIDDAGVIKGFATLARNSTESCVENLDDKVELQRLYVDVSAHRQGVGSLLVKSMEKIAKEEGFRNMWLGVWDENHKAMRAYEKWGYKVVGDHDFTIGSIVQTDFIMTKAL